MKNNKEFLEHLNTWYYNSNPDDLIKARNLLTRDEDRLVLACNSYKKEIELENSYKNVTSLTAYRKHKKANKGR